MNILNRNLIIALVLQIIILVVVLFSVQKNTEQQSTNLLSSDMSIIDTLTLQSEDNSVNISKKNNVWLQEDLQSFRVPAEKIENLLSTLFNIQIDFPVATSQEAAKRFNVDKETANTVVSMFSNGKMVETLYVGSGSGLRKVHVKTDNDNKIYSVELPAHLISTEKNDWIDTSLLNVKGDINSIKGGLIDLSLKKDRTWQSNVEIPEGKELKQAEVSKWVSQFNSFKIAKFIDEDIAETILTQNPIASYQINASFEGKKQSSEYTFFKDNDKHYVNRKGESHLFSILNYRAEDILKTDIDEFLENASIELKNQENGNTQNENKEGQNTNRMKEANDMENKIETNSKNDTD